MKMNTQRSLDWFRLACLAAISLPNLAAIEAAENARPNILFLLADDMRPDMISGRGNETIETPHLDRLMERGMTFSRATCSYPICVISRAEILTGQLGWENGVYGNSGARFEDKVTFWAETFREAGYRTGHVGKWHVEGRPRDRGYERSVGLFASGGGKLWKEGQVDWKGFPITGYRGWVFQDEEPRKILPERGIGLSPEISQYFVDDSLSWLEAKDDRPWMLHLNFTAPHDPLLLPEKWKDKYTLSDFNVPENFLPVHPFDHGNFDGRDESLLDWPRTESDIQDLLRVYVSVVEHMDQEIGRLLDHLEKTQQLESTIVIFTSDHGMACGSHGLRGKQNQYEHTINTPLIISGPRISRGTQNAAQVYLRELYPTTCDLAGISTPKEVSAESFAPVLLGKKESHHDVIFGYYKDSQRMVRSEDGWKLIDYPLIDQQQLFDLNQDPHERDNLVESADLQIQAKKEALAEKLNHWRMTAKDPFLSDSSMP